MEIVQVKVFRNHSETDQELQKKLLETISEGKAKLAYQPRDNKFLKLRRGDVVLVKGKKAGVQTDLWGGQEFLGQNEETEELPFLSNDHQKITIKRKRDASTENVSQGDKSTSKITSGTDGGVPPSTISQNLPEIEDLSRDPKLDTVATNADSSDDSKNPTIVDVPPLIATPEMENDFVTEEKTNSNENENENENEHEQNRPILSKEPAQTNGKQNEEGRTLTDAVTLTTTNPLLSIDMKELIDVSPEKGNTEINHIDDNANEETTETQQKQPLDINQQSHANSKVAFSSTHDNFLNEKDAVLANNPDLQNVEMQQMSQSPFLNNDQLDSVDTGGPTDTGIEKNETDKTTKLDEPADPINSYESKLDEHNINSENVELNHNYPDENNKQGDAEYAQERSFNTNNEQLNPPGNIPEESSSKSESNPDNNNKENKITQTGASEQHEIKLIKEEFPSSGTVDQLNDHTKTRQHLDYVSESEYKNANEDLPMTQFEEVPSKSVDYSSEIPDRDNNPVSETLKQVSDSKSGLNNSLLFKMHENDILFAVSSSRHAGVDLYDVKNNYFDANVSLLSSNKLLRWFFNNGFENNFCDLEKANDNSDELGLSTNEAVSLKAPNKDSDNNESTNREEPIVERYTQAVTDDQAGQRDVFQGQGTMNGGLVGMSHMHDGVLSKDLNSEHGFIYKKGESCCSWTDHKLLWWYFSVKNNLKNNLNRALPKINVQMHDAPMLPATELPKYNVEFSHINKPELPTCEKAIVVGESSEALSNITDKFTEEVNLSISVNKLKPMFSFDNKTCSWGDNNHLAWYIRSKNKYQSSSRTNCKLDDTYNSANLNQFTMLHGFLKSNQNRENINTPFENQEALTAVKNDNSAIKPKSQNFTLTSVKEIWPFYDIHNKTMSKKCGLQKLPATNGGFSKNKISRTLSETFNTLKNAKNFANDTSMFCHLINSSMWADHALLRGYFNTKNPFNILPETFFPDDQFLIKVVSGDDESKNIGKDATTQAGDDSQNLMKHQNRKADISDPEDSTISKFGNKDYLTSPTEQEKADKTLSLDNSNQDNDFPASQDVVHEKAVLNSENSQIVTNANQQLDLLNKIDKNLLSDNINNLVIPSDEEPLQDLAIESISFELSDPVDEKVNENIVLSDTHNKHGTTRLSELGKDDKFDKKDDIQGLSENNNAWKSISEFQKKGNILPSKPSNLEVIKNIQKKDVMQGQSEIDNGWKSMSEFKQKKDISFRLNPFNNIKETSNLPNEDKVDNPLKEVKIEVNGSENPDYTTKKEHDIKKIESFKNILLNEMGQITADPEAETCKDKTLSTTKDQNLFNQDKTIDNTLYGNGNISKNVDDTVKVDKNKDLVDSNNGEIFSAYDTNMENHEQKSLVVKDKELSNAFDKKKENQVETKEVEIKKPKFNANNVLEDVYNIADRTKESNKHSPEENKSVENFKVLKTNEKFTVLENSESNLKDEQTLASKHNEKEISNFDASRVKLQFLKQELKSKIENEAPLAIEIYQDAQKLRAKLIGIVKEIREMPQLPGEDSKDLVTLEAKEIKQRLQTLEGKINQWQTDEQNLKTESVDTKEDIQKMIQNLESLLEEGDHHQDTLFQAKNEAVDLKKSIENLENMLQKNRHRSETYFAQTAESLKTEVVDRQEMNSKAIESTEKENLLLQKKLFELQSQLDGNLYKNKNMVENVKEEAESLKKRLSLLENEIVERKQNEESVKKHSQQKEGALMGRISLLEKELMQRKADETAILTNKNESAFLKQKILELENNLSKALTTPDKKTDEKLDKLENELQNRKTSEQKALLKSQEQTSILENKIKLLEITLQNQQKDSSNKYQQEVVSIKNNLFGLQEELIQQKRNENVALKSSSEREQKLEDRIFMLEKELQHMASQEKRSQQNDERSNTLLKQITALETDLRIATGRSEHKNQLINQPRQDFLNKATSFEGNIIQDLYNIMASKQQCPLQENVTKTEVEMRSHQTINRPIADELNDQETGMQMTSLKEKKLSEKNGPSNEKFDQYVLSKELYESLHEGKVVDWDESVVEKKAPKTSSWDESLLNVEQFNAPDRTDLNDATNVNEPTDDDEHFDDSIPKIVNPIDVEEHSNDSTSYVNPAKSNSENITLPQNDAQLEKDDVKLEKETKDAFAKDGDRVEADELTIEENEAESKLKKEVTVETPFDYGDTVSETNSMGRKTAPREEGLKEDSFQIETEHPADELRNTDHTIETASGTDKTISGIDQIEYEEGTNPIQSATMKLFILVGKLPYDVFYILSPIGDFWLSLLPEEYQKNVFGVEWHIVLLTASIGFFFIWLLLWRSKVSKRKLKEARLCNTVEELKKQLDEIVTEKLSNENDLKNSQSELDEKKHAIDTAEHQLSVQLESNTKLQKKVDEIIEQNKQIHEEMNICSSKLKKVEEEKKKILNESIQKSNTVAENELTLKEMEKKLKQCQKESQDYEKQKKRLEDSLDDNRKQLKKEEKSKEDIIKKLEKFKRQADDADSQTKKLKQELEAVSKENVSTIQEVDILKDCLLQFKGIQDCLTEDGDDELSEDDIIIKQKEKLKNLIDVAAIQKQLKQTETEKSRVSFELEAERKSREETEARIGELEASCENEKSLKSKTERDLQLLQAKLNVMQEFYAKREVEMQGKLGKEQNAKELQQSQLEEQGDRSAKLLEQIAIYKRMNDEAKKEYENAEKQRKNEITQFEKKAHSNWLASREAERKLDEATREITQLRVELSDYQLRVRDMEDRDPIIVRPRPGVPPFPHRGHPNSPLPVRNGSLRMIGNTPPPPRRVPSPAGSLQDEIRRPDRPPSHHSHTGRRPPSQGLPPGPMYDNSFSGNRSSAPMHDEGFPPHQGDGPPPSMRGGPPPIRSGPPLLRDRPLRNDQISKRDAPPMVRDGPPPMRDGPPFISDGPPPMVRDGPPPMRDGPPFMREGPPPIREGPPFLRHGAQPMREIPPFARDGPPIMRDSPPPMADGPPLRYANPPMRAGPPRNPSGFQPMHRGAPPKRPDMATGPMTSSPYMERPPIPSQSPLGGPPTLQGHPPSSLLHSHANNDRVQNQRSNYDHDLI